MWMKDYILPVNKDHLSAKGMSELTLMLLGAKIANTQWCKKHNMKITETLAHGFSKVFASFCFGQK